MLSIIYCILCARGYTCGREAPHGGGQLRGEEDTRHDRLQGCANQAAHFPELRGLQWLRLVSESNCKAAFSSGCYRNEQKIFQAACYRVDDAQPDSQPDAPQPPPLEFIPYPGIKTGGRGRF